jgi:hypothetical protein
MGLCTQNFEFVHIIYAENWPINSQAKLEIKQLAMWKGVYVSI